MSPLSYLTRCLYDVVEIHVSQPLSQVEVGEEEEHPLEDISYVGEALGSSNLLI